MIDQIEEGDEDPQQPGNGCRASHKHAAQYGDIKKGTKCCKHGKLSVSVNRASSEFRE